MPVEKLKSVFKRVAPPSIRAALRTFMYRRSMMTSQAGQDYWVYGEVFNEKQNGYFLDIGAYDGIHASNTYLLERRYNWTGLCVEANPDTFESLRRNRNVPCVNVCLDETERQVSFVLSGVMSGIVDYNVDNKKPHADSGRMITRDAVSLNRLLQAHAVPSIVDYLSMDVEGAEERILSRFDFARYTFRCLTIERPSAVVRRLLDYNGYVLVKEIPSLDCFFIHRTFLEEYRNNLFNFYEKSYLTVRWR